MNGLTQRVAYLGGRRFTVTRDRFGTFYVHNEPRGGATYRPAIIGGRVTYGYRFDCYRLAAAGDSCPHCGAGWFGLRDVQARKLCMHCGQTFADES